MAEEGTDRGDPPSDRRGREPRGAHFREVPLQLLGRDLPDGPIEPGAYGRQVAAVRLHGLRRAPRREQRKKAFDLSVDHACPFGARPARPTPEPQALTLGVTDV